MGIKSPLLPVLLAVSLGLPAAASAQRAAGGPFYVLIEGTKQGLFANEAVAKAHPNRVAGLSFNYTVKQPRDPASGLPSGKRQHQPVILTKERGAASPQLFQALVSNETLKSVVFEFYQVNQATGAEELAHLVKLSNATISEIHQYSPPGGSTDLRQLEDVSFTFDAIEIQHLPGKTIAMDTWGAP
jgi:type VI secretion system secreted protein Hcp